MFRMTDRMIRKRITDKQTNAGEMIENKIGKYIEIVGQDIRDLWGCRDEEICSAGRYAGGI